MRTLVANGWLRFEIPVPKTCDEVAGRQSCRSTVIVVVVVSLCLWVRFVSEKGEDGEGGNPFGFLLEESEKGMVENWFMFLVFCFLIK